MRQYIKEFGFFLFNVLCFCYFNQAEGYQKNLSPSSYVPLKSKSQSSYNEKKFALSSPTEADLEELDSIVDLAVADFFRHSNFTNLEIPSLKKDNFSSASTLCEKIYKKYKDELETETEPVVAGSEIYKNVVRFLKELDSKIEGEVRDTIENPMICWNMRDFANKRLGYDVADEEGENGRAQISISTLEKLSFVALNSTGSTNSEKHCNMKKCTRRKDPNSCLNQIPVSAQGVCLSCWIYAAMLTMELNMCQEYDQTAVDISEEHFQDCTSKYSCNPGNIDIFLFLLESVKVLRRKVDHKYQIPPNPKRCEKGPGKINLLDNWKFEVPPPKLLDEIRKPNINMRSKFSVRVGTRELTRTPAGQEALGRYVKKAIMKFGGLKISMYMDNTVQPSHPGVKFKNFVVLRCDREVANHAMVMTGFGTYVDKRGNTREYYEIRNSWGAWWGDAGYFRLDTKGPPGCNGFVFSDFSYLRVLPKKPLLHTDLCKSKYAKCKNDSKCNLIKKNKENEVECICKDGWIGDSCDTYDKSSDPTCNTDPCQNGGTCALTGQFEYQCSCPIEWAGKNCQFKNLCAEEPGPCGEENLVCSISETGLAICSEKPKISVAGLLSIGIIVGVSVGLGAFFLWFYYPNIIWYFKNLRFPRFRR